MNPRTQYFRRPSECFIAANYLFSFFILWIRMVIDYCENNGIYDRYVEEIEIDR